MCVCKYVVDMRCQNLEYVTGIFGSTPKTRERRISVRLGNVNNKGSGKEDWTKTKQLGREKFGRYFEDKWDYSIVERTLWKVLKRLSSEWKGVY